MYLSRFRRDIHGKSLWSKQKAASAPLEIPKIAAYFEKEKKQELCYELACFATFTGDREFEVVEKSSWIN